ncbi:phosphatase PAP2 family protein [Dysgonomonas sp. Marseille-P4677]|nr:phosphatase PAP2 family protein [Dysgonomonas sp. Marseille-P4677]
MFFVAMLFIQNFILCLNAQNDSCVNVISSKSCFSQDSISLHDIFLHKVESPTSFPKINDFGYVQSERQMADLEFFRKRVSSDYPRWIAPVGFITYGILSQENHLMKELDKSTNYEVTEHFSHPMTYDNYLQFLPAASVYGLNFLDIKGQNDLKDVTLIMLTSHLIMAGTVNILKNTTNVLRPDGSSSNSFPSGHTATSFVGAHILFREYISFSPYIAFSGYLVSSATGILRVLNKRHWVSDVFMGAGIGILSVEISYFLLPLINNILYPNVNGVKKQLAIVPNLDRNQYGLGLSYVF